MGAKRPVLVILDVEFLKFGVAVFHTWSRLFNRKFEYAKRIAFAKASPSPKERLRSAFPLTRAASLSCFESPPYTWSASVSAKRRNARLDIESFERSWSAS